LQTQLFDSFILVQILIKSRFFQILSYQLFYLKCGQCRCEFSLYLKSTYYYSQEGLRACMDIVYNYDFKFRLKLAWLKVLKCDINCMVVYRSYIMHIYIGLMIFYFVLDIEISFYFFYYFHFLNTLYRPTFDSCISICYNTDTG
jgi:hypothetical protein